MRSVLAAVRVVLGLTFAVAGVLLFANVDRSTEAFAAWHVPMPQQAVWVVGAVDVVCGLLFAAGALVRPVGLLLATIAVGYGMTAGRHGPAAYALVAAVAFLGCVFFAWRSDRVSIAGPSRPPGVQ